MAKKQKQIKKTTKEKPLEAVRDVVREVTKEKPLKPCMEEELKIEQEFIPFADRFYKSMGLRIKRNDYNRSSSDAYLQSVGIDCFLSGSTEDGEKVISVSEKFRTQDWGDLMVEFRCGKKDGWVLTEAADCLNYFVQTQDIVDPEYLDPENPLGIGPLGMGTVMKVYTINMKELRQYVEHILNDVRLQWQCNKTQWNEYLDNHQAFEVDGRRFIPVPTYADSTRTKIAYWGWTMILKWEELRGKVRYAEWKDIKRD